MGRGVLLLPSWDSFLQMDFFMQWICLSLHLEMSRHYSSEMIHPVMGMSAFYELLDAIRFEF